MIGLTPKSFDEFKTRAASASVVAVVRSVPADLLTPVAAYIRMSANSRYAFLLESVEGGEHLARYSFLGVDPYAVVRTVNGVTTVERNGEASEVKQGTAIDYLRAHFAAHMVSVDSGSAPLAGGAVGYLGYGAARWFDPAIETLPSGREDAFFMLFRTVLAFDHARQELQIRSLAFLPESRDDASIRDAYEHAVAETEAVVARLSQERTPNRSTRAGVATAFDSNFSKDEFEAAVRNAQELIAAGECYQAVLSQKFSRKTSASPLAIYRALRVTNPSPYMVLLMCGDHALIGASPEMLVRCRGRQLEYRPIAGTRPRGSSPEQDEFLAEELLADEKERSEHVMLVDLGRNDLGRVSKFGSVRRERYMKIEKYSHVQHLVTELRAELRDDCDRFDALGACFPAGTVTGAPKIRAMKAIADLEGKPRGVYSGAVLYADYAGNLDSCIAIRTIEYRDGVAHVQAGAGIVADSVPAMEYEETINKSRALRSAVEFAEVGF